MARAHSRVSSSNSRRQVSPLQGQPGGGCSYLEGTAGRCPSPDDSARIGHLAENLAAQSMPDLAERGSLGIHDLICCPRSYRAPWVIFLRSRRVLIPSPAVMASAFGHCISGPGRDRRGTARLLAPIRTSRCNSCKFECKRPCREDGNINGSYRFACLGQPGCSRVAPISCFFRTSTARRSRGDNAPSCCLRLSRPRGGRRTHQLQCEPPSCCDGSRRA